MPNPIGGSQPVSTQVFTEATAKTQDAVKKAEDRAAAAEQEAIKTRQEMGAKIDALFDFIKNGKSPVDAG